MLHTARAYQGMVVTPHRLASEAGIAVLRKGGNAIEAAVAAAATLCVAYPHMTGLGGDAFWLILPGSAAGAESSPLFIDASGRSAQQASHALYTRLGCAAVPKRGPLAAMTMAGAVSGWEAALDVAATLPGKGGKPPLALEALFEDAVRLAENGVPVTKSQQRLTHALLPELDAGAPLWTDKARARFARCYLADGKAPAAGDRLVQEQLAKTLRTLAAEGLDSFYRGSIAKSLAEDLESAGSPLRPDDFTAHRAEAKAPLELRLHQARLYNSPPPTQGVASLMILGLVERFMQRNKVDPGNKAALVHAVVEATKQAFLVRDRYVADPHAMEVDPQALLDPALLDELAARMEENKALPWPQQEPFRMPGGDTVWIGVMDRFGNTVSCIQSIYHEFGSCLLLPQTGILWHNRSLGFTFAPGFAGSLAPGKKPFHTLNPALARFDDGRIAAYGTMGGEGQPQTQAAIFLRCFTLGQSPQKAISEPRWLLGRAWGDTSDTLKLEAPFYPENAQHLTELGHDTERVPAFSSLMGHAGMLIRHPDGLLEGAADPRGDGTAACW